MRRAWPMCWPDGARALLRLLRALCATMALTVLAACTPTLDWREVRPGAAEAVALFPCKPASHARELALAGQQVKLTLHACQAGDATWGLAWADVGDPGRVADALQALQDHGALVGSYFTVARLARCHPWCAGGRDEVPAHPPRLFTRLVSPFQSKKSS